MDREVVAAILVAAAFVVAGVWYTTDWIGFRQPMSTSKWLAAASIALIALALVLAILDGRAKARFRSEARRIAAERPAAASSEYEGPEGDGLLFADASARVLLLRPAGGFGAPRVVTLPAVEVPVDVPAEPTDQTSAVL